jgi:hypothetical protein
MSIDPLLLSDTEIGQLWSDWHEIIENMGYAAGLGVAVVQVIRKLVHERALHKPIEEVLRDFGIDPKEF